MRGGVISVVALACLGLAILMTHPFGLLALLLFSIPALPRLAISRRPLLPLALAAVPVLVFSLWFLRTWRSFAGSSIRLGLPFKLQYLARTPWIVADGSSHLFSGISVAAAIALVCVLAAAVIRKRNREPGGWHPAPSTLWVALALFISLVLYFVLPFALGEMIWADLRLATPVWLLLIACIDSDRTRSLAAAALALVVAASCITGVWIMHSRFDREMSNLEKVIDAVPPEQTVLAIALDQKSAAYEPFYVRNRTIDFFSLYIGFGNYYHVRKGGLGPFMIFGFPWSPLHIRDAPDSWQFGSADIFHGDYMLWRLQELAPTFDVLLLRTRDRQGFPWLSQFGELIAESGEYSAWRVTVPR